MSFYGYSFAFNGIPCEEHGLMMYDFGSPQDAGGSFTSSGSVVEERISRKYKPLYYGTLHDKPLEFSLVFGANNTLIDANKFLDRWDMETISSWLTGKDGYKWLEIQQPDMETLRYRCIITDLKYSTVGWLPWAFACKVVCDSPFAYTFPEVFSYTFNHTVADPLLVRFYNRSTHNGVYYPKLDVTLRGRNFFTIINESDANRSFSFTNLPSITSTNTLRLEIDSENGIIKSSRSAVNPYNHFDGFSFFRLIRGDNLLKVSGNGTLHIIAEFPVNIGG